jgi:ectoine hydroxylase-related dioxygenase (phytanoyl-CoA dioxygenase family)
VSDWLASVLEDLRFGGVAVAPGVLTSAECDRLSAAIDAGLERETRQFGEARLRELHEHGTIRCPCAFDPIFLAPIVDPRVLEVVDATVGPTAILHTQNALVTFPGDEHWQGRFHRDFAKDFVTDRPLSVNALWALDAFDATTGATWFVPGTHRDSALPTADHLEGHAVQIEAPRGSIVFFDSYTVHRAGRNGSRAARRALNHQYTRPFVKQQMDIAHMMRDKGIDPESRLAQKLGLWSVPPRSLEEFRVDPPHRTYRSGQG